ncbi:MAG: hypothetical protein ACRDSR_28190 [Pseudonocardiaceae bacterium]
MTVLSIDEAWAGLYTLASYLSWWQGLIVAVVGAGARVLHRQQAQQARQRTLQMLVEKVSAGTVVWQEKGWGRPAVTLWIGASHPTHQEGSS